MLPVVIGVVFIVFTISHFAGDPVLTMLGDNYTQEQYDAVEHQLGLDRPFFVQFFDYVVNIVTQFDLGTSYLTRQDVREEVLIRMPISLKLAFLSMAFSIAVGAPLGVISAVRQYSKLDYTVTVSAMLCASMPGFWVGLMLIIIFSLNLGIVPASGIETWKHWILPCIAIGMMPIASICRMTRSTMLEVIRQDYIRTARSKGVSELKVIWSHALKNVAIPVITLIGTMISVTIGNSVVIESVFTVPGLGSYIVSAIYAKDYNCVVGAVFVFALVICVINLIIDVVYGYIDPRIKAQYIAAGKKMKKPVSKATT
jgi:peptide/nickel transport system permease protein